MGDQRAYLLRSLCFFDALGYAPTRVECLLACEGRVDPSTLQALFDEGIIAEQAGRLGFSGRLDALVSLVQERDRFVARKLRRARMVARWLSFFGGIRFVALANTTAWGYASDGGDLDFFIIVRRGSIWQSRLFAVFPFKFLGWLPGPEESPDAVCLSYFVADDALDLSSHQIGGDDPYFRHWFFALLPLLDDGVSPELWQINSDLIQKQPSQRPWQIAQDLRVPIPRFRLPIFSFFEWIAQCIQRAWFPSRIREMENVDSRVMVSDQVLKFHTDDGRELYRERYIQRLTEYGLEP